MEGLNQVKKANCAGTAIVYTTVADRNIFLFLSTDLLCSYASLIFSVLGSMLETVCLDQDIPSLAFLQIQHFRLYISTFVDKSMAFLFGIVSSERVDVLTAVSSLTIYTWQPDAR